jgi:hypothetical protein
VLARYPRLGLGIHRRPEKVPRPEKKAGKGSRGRKRFQEPMHEGQKRFQEPMHDTISPFTADESRPNTSRNVWESQQEATRRAIAWPVVG